MPKSVWKFGKNWVGVKNGKKKFFPTRQAASKYAGTSRKSKAKTKSKSKTKRKSTRTKIKRRVSRIARRKKGSSGRKAMSVNLAKTAAIAGTVGLLLGGAGGNDVIASARSGNWRGALTQIWLNARKNAGTLIGMNVAVALLGRALGSYAPRFGIKKAISVKAF